jgi:hypothetical protein
MCTQNGIVAGRKKWVNIFKEKKIWSFLIRVSGAAKWQNAALFTLHLDLNFGSGSVI